jgi:hypothetical protein
MVDRSSNGHDRESAADRATYAAPPKGPFAMRRMDTFAETMTKTPPVPLPLAGECYQYASRRQDQERVVAPGSAPLGEAWLDPEGR